MARRQHDSRELHRTILNVADAVHRRLGPNSTVSEMERRFVDEIVARRVRVTRRNDTTLTFGGRTVEKILADVLLEDQVMVEFKRLPTVTAADLYRFAQFLKGAHCREGFIINLGGAGLDCRYLRVTEN